MNDYAPVLIGGALGLVSVVVSACVAAACVLSGRIERAQEAAQEVGQQPALPDPLVAQALAAIDAQRAASAAYKEWGGYLQGRLAAVETEREDWRQAAAYHAESVRRQQGEIAELQAAGLRLQQENAALRAALIQRTQEALAAGLVNVLRVN